MTLSEIYEKADVHRLPVDPIAAASALGIKVISYKTAADIFDTDIRGLYSRCPLGFSFKMDGRMCIALNENSCGEQRRRFTAAHELAHCVLRHLDDKRRSAYHERAADSFAAELLAPLVVLRECKVNSAEEISKMCGISRRAAEICLNRLALRDERGFSESEDERRVKTLFSAFIESYR